MKKVMQTKMVLLIRPVINASVPRKMALNRSNYLTMSKKMRDCDLQREKSSLKKRNSIRTANKKPWLLGESTNRSTRRKSNSRKKLWKV